MIDASDLDGLSEAELVARMEEAAALEDGWFEAEQMGQAISKLGEQGVRVLELLVDHPSEHVAAGSIHGLWQVDGWSLRNTATLRRLIFGTRPDVAAMALDASYGDVDNRRVCFIPEIADDVAHELAHNTSVPVRSAAIGYLSVCAPIRHFDTVVAGFADPEASVRLTAVTRVGWLQDHDVLRRAIPHLWLRLDDEDIVVRDWAQLAIELNVWSPDDDQPVMPFTDDPDLLTYSRTRVDLGPGIGPSDVMPDMGAIGDSLKDDQPQAARRGAADELEEWLMSTYDGPTIMGITTLAHEHADDADPRVRQATAVIIEEAATRWPYCRNAAPG